jgi:hypothetical protein
MPRFDAVGVGGDRADVPVNVGRTLGPDWMETVFLRSPNLYGVSLLDVGPERVLTYLVLKRVERLGFEEAASPIPDTGWTAVATTGVVGTEMLIELIESLVLTCSIFRSCAFHGWAGDGEGENKTSRQNSNAGDVRCCRYRRA